MGKFNEIFHVGRWKDSKNPARACALSASISLKKLKEEARLFKAFSDSTRLKILKLLTYRKMCVCELNLAIDTSQPTISHHLNILENAGLISGERQGKWMFYSISNEMVSHLLKKFEKLNVAFRR